MASRRLERLNEQLRAEISDLVARELRDPGLSGLVTITAVETSPDLHHARVYASTLGGEEERGRIIAALQRAAGFLRRKLAERLSIRHVPELSFRPDVSIERGERIMRLLRGIRDEEPGSQQSDALADSATRGSPSQDVPGEDQCR